MFRIGYSMLKRSLKLLGVFVFITAFCQLYYLSELHSLRNKMQANEPGSKPMISNVAKKWQRVKQSRSFSENLTQVLTIVVTPAADVDVQHQSKQHTVDTLHKLVDTLSNVSSLVPGDTFKNETLQGDRSQGHYKGIHIEKLTLLSGNDNSSQIQQNWFDPNTTHLLNKLKVSKFNRQVRKNGELKTKTYIKIVLDLSVEEVEKLVDDTVTWFNVSRTKRKDVLLNKHDFVYRLNSNACVGTKINVLIIIHSALGNTGKRKRIRNTWGSIKSHNNASVAIVFMLGEHRIPTNTLHKTVGDESQQYGDIVLGNFLDSYRNLTYKHIMALHWITTRCRDVETIVKIDDDVFVDVYKMVQFSINTGHIHNSLYCSILEMEQPKRSGKWKASTKDFPFPIYPVYCEGMAYIMSMNEARKLCQASRSMSFFWIDDVYVTGILARRAGLKHVTFQRGQSAVKKRWFKNESSAEVDKAMFYIDFKDWNTLFIKVKKYHNASNS